MKDLKDKRCVPCEGGVPPFSEAEIKTYLPQIGNEWNILENKKLERVFAFKTFLDAISFVNEVAKIAEQEQHHPNIRIVYSKVTLTLSTHTIQGLSENDFILAAKINSLYQSA